MNDLIMFNQEEARKYCKEISAMCENWKDAKGRPYPLQINSIYVCEIFLQGNYVIKTEIDGDWKHEHLRFEYIVNEYFKKIGVEVIIDQEAIEDSKCDWYKSTHVIKKYSELFKLFR